MENFQNKKIFIAGHRGMVGSALVRKLNQHGDCKLLLRTSSELDLCNQAATNEFFESEKPDVVIFAAAKVGGIHANNTYPADFIYDNLMMASNSIHAAYQNGVESISILGKHLHLPATCSPAHPGRFAVSPVSLKQPTKRTLWRKSPA